MLKELATIKDYHLFETRIGTYKITHNGTVVANPATEEQAWEKIKVLAGVSYFLPSCWSNCRLHNCKDCERDF